jgi:hypothetical protein
MTQHYLAGELSLYLAELHNAARGETRERAVAHLRREAETGPLTSLPSVLDRALILGDRMCWDSLTRGDATAFQTQAAACADLYQFGDVAELVAARSLR